MASVNFYLKDPKSTKDTPINMHFAYGGKRPLKYASGDKIHPKDWSADKQRIREKRTVDNCEERNAYLSKMEAAINTIYKKLLLEEVEITEELLRERLDLDLNRNKKTKHSTLLAYGEALAKSKKDRGDSDGYLVAMVVKNLKKYCTTKKVKLDFEDMTLAFRDKFNAFLYELDYKQNSVRTNFSALRIILNYATDEKINTNMEYKSNKFTAKSEKVKKFALKDTELKAILDLDLSEQPALYDEVRDIFLIGAYVGMRVSDYAKLSKESIVDNKIYRKTQKTGKHVIVPIHPVVRKILDKRGGEFPPTHDKAVINKIIKDVCQLAEINSKVIISYTQGGKRVDQVKEKWETITTHTARRSGATGMLKAGIDREKVKMITGHESDEAFSLYIDIDQEENATELANHPYFQ